MVGHNERKLDLYIEIVSCRGLLAGNPNGSSDPYVKVKLGRKTVHQTKKIKKTLNPMYSDKTKSKCWLECTESELIEARGLLFKIQHSNLVGKDDELGEVQIPTNKIMYSKSNPVEYKINPPKNRKGQKRAGILTLRCHQSSSRNIITGEKSPAGGASGSMPILPSFDYSERHSRQQMSEACIDMFRKKKIEKNIAETREDTTTCIDMTQTSDDFYTHTSTTSMDDVATTGNHYEHQLYLQKMSNNINPEDELAFFIEIVSFRDLLTTEETSSADPLVEIKLGSRVMHQTKQISQIEKAETYDTKSLIKCTARELFQSGGLNFYVMINQQGSSSLPFADSAAILGEVTVSAESLCNNQKGGVVEYTISPAKHRSREDHAGFLSLICRRVLDDKSQKGEKSRNAFARSKFEDHLVNSNNEEITTAKELQQGEPKEKALVHNDEAQYFDNGEEYSRLNHDDQRLYDEDTSIDEYNHDLNDEDTSIDEYNHDLNDEDTSIDEYNHDLNADSSSLTSDDSQSDENNSAQYHDHWSKFTRDRVPSNIKLPIKINEQESKNQERGQKANSVVHTKVSEGKQITTEYQDQLSTIKEKGVEAEINSKDIQDKHFCEEAYTCNESSLSNSNIKITIKKNLGKDDGRGGKGIPKRAMSSLSASEAQEISFEENDQVGIADRIVGDPSDIAEEDQSKKERTIRDEQQIVTAALDDNDNTSRTSDEAQIETHISSDSNIIEDKNIEDKNIEEKCNLKVEPFPLWLSPTAINKKNDIPKKAIIHGKITYKTFEEKFKRDESIIWIEFHNLDLSHSIDDYQLATALLNNSNIEKLSFLGTMTTLNSENRDDYPPLLHALSSMQNLKELEIHMKHGKRTLPSSFFEDLFESSYIESLVLWNVVLMPMHMVHLITALRKSQTLERFEIWRSEALGGGRSFATLAQQILKSNNKKLRTMVLSHVGLDADDCEVIENALQQNYTLDEMALLNVPLPVAESLIKKDHNNLQQFVTTTEELSYDGCLALREKLYTDCFTPPRRGKKCIACRLLDKYVF